MLFRVFCQDLFSSFHMPHVYILLNSGINYK